MGKFTGLEALKIAKDMKCRVKRPTPRARRKKIDFVDIVCGDHSINIGTDYEKYFLNTVFKGKLLWHKHGLTKSQVDKMAIKALAGFDLGEILKKRLGR